jgi:hypothetical protein
MNFKEEQANDLVLNKYVLGIVQTCVGSMIFYDSVIFEPNTAMPRTPQR